MTINKQVAKCNEEITELTQAVVKKDLDNIVEELADCFVALERLKMMLQEEYHFDELEFLHMKLYKVARTERRIKEGYYSEK